MRADAGLFAGPGAAGACLAAAAAERHGPYSGASPERLAELAAGIDPFPEEGAGLDAALAGLGRLSLAPRRRPGPPVVRRPPALPAAGRRRGRRRQLAGAANQSLDSWDQGPVATPPGAAGWWLGWPPGSAGTPRLAGGV